MLLNYYNKSKIYSFECNPDCLIECNKNISNLNNSLKSSITLVNRAVSLVDGDVIFYPFGL